MNLLFIILVVKYNWFINVFKYFIFKVKTTVIILVFKILIN